MFKSLKRFLNIIIEKLNALGRYSVVVDYYKKPITPFTVCFITLFIAQTYNMRLLFRQFEHVIFKPLTQTMKVAGSFSNILRTKTDANTNFNFEIIK